MLVLSRCEQETIEIDGNIEITVLEISRLNGRKQVKFGITAPKEISIHRHNAKEKLNMPAATA